MNSSNNNKNLEKPLVVSYLRWSTGKQKLGDSERRQLDSAEEWLNENGYEVNEDFILKDDGKSGYHSENFSDEGALGKFIAKVKEGKIPKGTILLIEDFSRFSRAQINLAQQRFLELINNDIRVYIVKDKKLYQKESYTLEDMIVSLAKMAAAHEESDRKSNHLKKFWAARRKVAGENKNIDEYPLLLPSTVPDWIKKVKKGSQTYLELIPERVEVIKYIFELADTGGKDGLGLGSSIIVRKLENEGIKPFKGERKNTAITFTDSYVVCSGTVILATH
ncbi:recombinase family protein [Pseudoalteromonas sp. APC 3215]|nr:recombinase family protein [Pseudoalteromonas sp. APC 3215]MDN3395501.1 recombinase family protein [Pseudoalteromonas sp. APC 3215]